ncbi:uncharacterized protein LOC121854839 [Homarus americanus]|uniref:uncharacterized protein LOC121854839 n=1 Tax=Homarus americanus TaxID=6706 RepID=UPI001C4974F2|nr:uncharacterized protein LOC121854839 [Homarus americanus]
MAACYCNRALDAAHKRNENDKNRAYGGSKGNGLDSGSQPLDSAVTQRCSHKAFKSQVQVRTTTRRGFKSLPQVTSGLEILKIDGPSVVVNGSKPQLILDCEYDITEYDKSGLVVKWYFNRQPFPVYQWIPRNEPQDLGILKGRLNLEYEVSDEEFTKHRALAIVNPTTELTGEYTCWISSFESEDFRRKSLIVYAPASDMSMTYSKPSEERVIVSCRAGGIFPKPNIDIFRSTSASSRDVFEGAKVESQHLPEHGYYNISIELEVFDYELDSETMFECVLTIPGTEYQLHEEILYFPGPPTTTTTTTTTTTPTPTTTSAPEELEDEVEEDYDEEEEGLEVDDNDNDDFEIEEETKGAKPHVAESGVPAVESSVSGGVIVMVSSLTFISLLPLLHYFWLQ